MAGAAARSTTAIDRGMDAYEFARAVSIRKSWSSPRRSSRRNGARPTRRGCRHTAGSPGPRATSCFAQAQAEMAGPYEIELMVTTWDRRENDLDRGKKSVWRVVLVDEQGNEIEPLEIVKDKRPSFTVRADFPAFGDFATAVHRAVSAHDAAARSQREGPPPADERRARRRRARVGRAVADATASSASDRTRDPRTRRADSPRRGRRTTRLRRHVRARLGAVEELFLGLLSVDRVATDDRDLGLGGRRCGIAGGGVVGGLSTTAAIALCAAARSATRIDGSDERGGDSVFGVRSRISPVASVISGPSCSGNVGRSWRDRAATRAVSAAAIVARMMPSEGSSSVATGVASEIGGITGAGATIVDDAVIAGAVDAIGAMVGSSEIRTLGIEVTRAGRVGRRDGHEIGDGDARVAGLDDVERLRDVGAHRIDTIGVWRQRRTEERRRRDVFVRRARRFGDERWNAEDGRLGDGGAGTSSVAAHRRPARARAPRHRCGRPGAHAARSPSRRSQRPRRPDRAEGSGEAAATGSQSSRRWPSHLRRRAEPSRTSRWPRTSCASSSCWDREGLGLARRSHDLGGRILGRDDDLRLEADLRREDPVALVGVHQRLELLARAIARRRARPRRRVPAPARRPTSGPTSAPITRGTSAPQSMSALAIAGGRRRGASRRLLRRDLPLALALARRDRRRVDARRCARRRPRASRCRRATRRSRAPRATSPSGAASRRPASRPASTAFCATRSVSNTRYGESSRMSASTRWPSNMRRTPWTSVGICLPRLLDALDVLLEDRRRRQRAGGFAHALEEALGVGEQLVGRQRDLLTADDVLVVEVEARVGPQQELVERGLAVDQADLADVTSPSVEPDLAAAQAADQRQHGAAAERGRARGRACRRRSSRPGCRRGGRACSAGTPLQDAGRSSRRRAGRPGARGPRRRRRPRASARAAPCPVEHDRDVGACGVSARGRARTSSSAWPSVPPTTTSAGLGGRASSCAGSAGSRAGAPATPSRSNPSWTCRPARGSGSRTMTFEGPDMREDRGCSINRRRGRRSGDLRSIT